MLTEKQREEILNDIDEATKRDEILFLTIDGVRAANLDAIVNQPIEGLLYDLNRDEATLRTLFKSSGEVHFINDIALVKAFKRTVEQLINKLG